MTIDGCHSLPWFIGKTLIHWPCILKHSDDAELIYIRNQDEWDNDTDLHRVAYEPSDCLIDVLGNVYSLTTIENTLIHPVTSGETMSLQTIMGLVKAHASQKGSCCVAKLYAPTIVEAFTIVESLNEQ